MKGWHPEVADPIGYLVRLRDAADEETAPDAGDSDSAILVSEERQNAEDGRDAHRSAHNTAGQSGLPTRVAVPLSPGRAPAGGGPRNESRNGRP